MMRRPPGPPPFPYPTLFRSLGPHPDVAAVPVDDDPPRRVEPEAGPGAHRLGGEERLEHAALDVLWDARPVDRKSTRLNSSHANISYALFWLKKNSRAGMTNI